MKKKVLVLGIFIILNIVGLSGCFEETPPNVEGVWYEDGTDGKWTFYKNKTLVQDFGEHGKFILKWDMDSKYFSLIYDDFTTKFTYEFRSENKILYLDSSEYGDVTLRR